MQTSWFKFAAAVFAAVLVAGCNNPPSKPKVAGGSGTEPVPILASHSGSDAAFVAQEYLINSADDTKADLSALNPNYETQSVVVIALGEMPTGGHSVAITGVQKKGDTLYVQFRVTQPAADAVVTQAITHPYAAVLIPKFAGNVLPEEDLN